MNSALLLHALACVAFVPLSAEPAGIGSELAYSNTLGTTAVAFGAGVMVADDFTLTRVAGCRLARIEFDVDGNTDGLGAGPFAVDYELFDDCPGSGGLAIAGTRGHVDFGNNGRYTVSFSVPAGVGIALPRTVWLAVTFNRDHAGWLGGALPLVGYSQDLLFAPPLGCGFFFGGFPGAPHASLNARLYVRSGCPEAHVQYLADSSRRGAYNPGLNVRMADDVTLDGPCQMIRYELTVRGTGLYDMDLRTVGASGVPGTIVPGTSRSVQSFGAVLRTLRQDFDPPIPLPPSFWFTVSANSTLARTSIVGLPPKIGNSQPTFAVQTGDNWEIKPIPEGFANGAFELAIVCAGAAPVGACCDMHFPGPDGNAVCREVARANCAWPPRGSAAQPPWREGESCTPDPFNPPCGTAACCLSDGTCANLTESECAPRGSSWTKGVYCGAPNLLCPNLCVRSEGSCTLPHGGRGCIDPECCNQVCSLTHQAFCCQVAWDLGCSEQALSDCGLIPSNDECFSPLPGQGARLVTTNSNTSANTADATDSPSDPGFCCHGHDPGAKGFGSVWFRFVATGTSARVRTCLSGGGATDALLQVFEAADNTSLESACRTLRSIGCNDDSPGCSTSNMNSSVCVRNLTVGRTYYVLLAAKSAETRGLYRLSVNPSCTEAAALRCPCPDGIVRWIDPPSGVVDARRPHSRSDSGALQGLSEFVVEAPLGSDQAACWTLCETNVTGAPNAVQSVVPVGSGRYRITLARPITPGAVTTLTLGDDGSTRGVFASHPANVNADSVSAPTDLLDLIDALNGVRFLPWDELSGDLNRSGSVTPTDILEAIDLLNGADAFDSWSGTFLPDPATCGPGR